MRPRRRSSRRHSAVRQAIYVQSRHGELRVASRATGRGTREAGSAGNCESTHEADNAAIETSSNVEEAETLEADDATLNIFAESKEAEARAVAGQHQPISVPRPELQG